MRQRPCKRPEASGFPARGWRFGFALALALTSAVQGHTAAAADQAEPAAAGVASLAEQFARTPPAAVKPDFQRHVVPLLGNLGCSGRACHGSFQGRGGFRLSLFGSDLEKDLEALTSGKEPRVNRRAPDDSLLLLKATENLTHGGGKRFDADSWQYRLLKRWIETSATRPTKKYAVMRLQVTPAEVRLDAAGPSRQLTAVAAWSDEVVENVTGFCRYSSTDEQIASVSREGMVTVHRPGEATILISYDRGIAAVPVSVPLSDQLGDRYPAVSAPTPVDERVRDKLRTLGIVPSDVCTDGEFLRRVSLDVTGTLPTPAEIEAFLADSSPDKRQRKIDELLETPAYAAKWTTWLCDITGNNPSLLNDVELGGAAASKHWFDWMYDRIARNVPYDELAAGIVAGTSREPGESYDDYRRAVAALSATGSQQTFASRNSMPYFWARSDFRKSPAARARAFAYTFLGMRLQCAECHKHPFDVWTEDDVRRFSKFFERVTFDINPDAKPQYTAEVARLTGDNPRGLGQVYRDRLARGEPIPLKEVFAPRPARPAPRNLSGTAAAKAVAAGDLSSVEDPREILVAWLRSEDCPSFAKVFVNRVWAQYFGVGIVDPPDDLSLGNPPTNFALLQYLSDGFVAHGYNMKWLHREITRSRTYQLAATSNESNKLDRQNFSHFLPQQLPAEVVYDSLRQATASTAAVARFRTDVQERAIADVGSRQSRRAASSYSLSIFGQSTRTSGCDCDRSAEPSLLQTIYLRNDPEVYALLDRPDGWIAELAALEKRPREGRAPAAGPRDALVREAYLRTLSRPPTTGELARSTEWIEAAPSVSAGVRELLWALLNTKEFLVKH